MARIHQTGFETGSYRANLSNTGPSMDLKDWSGTFSNSGARSGSGCMHIASSAMALAEVRFANFGTTFTDAFVRWYAKFDAFPSSTSVIVTRRADQSSGFACFELSASSSGVLTLVGGSGSSVALSTGVYHLVEVRTVNNGGGSYTHTLRVNGTDSGTLTNSNNAGNLDQFVNAAGLTLRVDDYAVNDTTGSVNNSWCGASDGVLWMAPISDAQRGSWTGGAGGTTNLWDAVNNVPQTGTASETDATQIESADSSGDNATDEYRAALTTYATLGIGSSDTIHAVVGWILHGEDVATGTKTGSIRLLSNPADSGAVAFTAGNDVGALGTHPTNWYLARTNIVQTPSVTVGTSPQMALRKTDTGTRVASVEFMGAYVDFTKAVSLTAATTKVWGGSTWATKPAKVWDGSTWATKTVKVRKT